MTEEELEATLAEAKIGLKRVSDCFESYSSKVARLEKSLADLKSNILDSDRGDNVLRVGSASMTLGKYSWNMHTLKKEMK